MGEKELWVPHRRETWPWRVGTLKRDVIFQTWNGHGAVVVSGTPVKIVMVSRLGDVGISTDLSADTGYGARVLLEDISALTPATQEQEKGDAPS